MRGPTLPVVLHPRYSDHWRAGQPLKSAVPQQYPYTESETMSTDENAAEFAQYRRYKYGQSFQYSMSLLGDIGKAEVEDESWPKMSWTLGDETRPASRQQEQIRELRGLRRFSSGYPKVTYNDVMRGSQSTSRDRPGAQMASKPTTLHPDPVTGRMLGLGGTAPSQPPQSLSHSQNIEIPSSRAPSSVHERSGQDGDSSGRSLGLGSAVPSSRWSISRPVPDNDDNLNANSRPQDASACDVQIGVEIEFLVPSETETDGERRELGQEYDRYFIPLEQQQETTLVNGIPAREYISQFLRDAGFPAVCDHDIREEVRQARARFRGPLDLEDEYAFWVVKPESSNMIIMPRSSVFDYVGLEFASRKLKANAQGFHEIREAIRLLRRHVLVAISTSCGIHVHVDATILNLQERKHFLCLYILVERELFSLTAPHRRTGNKWCEPIIEVSRLAEDAEDVLRASGEFDEDEQPPLAKMTAMMALILECANTEDLQEAIGKNRVPPFDRAALVHKRVGHQSYTFEFRHFQASLDPEVVEHFIRLCVAMIMAAKALGEPGRPSFEDMWEVFRRIEGWQDLLATVGLQDAIGFWTTLLSTYPVAGSSRSEEDKPSSFLPPLA